MTNDSRPIQPAAIMRPARNEVRLRAQQIRRPPAKRLAEALLEQFPDIDIALRDDGWTAAAVLNNHAVMLCEQYKHERDLREGWWTLMDEVYPQLAVHFHQVQNPPVANEEPQYPDERPDADDALETAAQAGALDPKPSASVIDLSKARAHP